MIYNVKKVNSYRILSVFPLKKFVDVMWRRLTHTFVGDVFFEDFLAKQNEVNPS